MQETGAAARWSRAGVPYVPREVDGMPTHQDALDRD